MFKEVSSFVAKGCLLKLLKIFRLLKISLKVKNKKKLPLIFSSQAPHA